MIHTSGVIRAPVEFAAGFKVSGGNLLRVFGGLLSEDFFICNTQPSPDPPNISLCFLL